MAGEERVVEFEHVFENISFDVVGLLEIRREGEHIVRRRNGNVWYYFGQSKGHRGVGFYVHKRCANRISEFRGISERIALIKIKMADSVTVNIIQVYAPTSSAPKEDTKYVYKTLEETLEEVRGQYTFMVGDFNAKVGSEPEVGPCVGPHVGGVTNRNGHKLAKFCMRHNLKIANTYFEPLLERWTWRSPDGVTRREIDHLLTESTRLVSDSSVIHNLVFSSDHRPVKNIISIPIAFSPPLV